MRVTLETTLPGIGPERALTWWTNVQEGPHDHAFIPGAHRTVHHHVDDSYEVDDRVLWLGIPVFTEHAHARVRGNTVRLVGENTMARFEAIYRFEPRFDPEGTILTLEALISPRGPLAWIETLLRPLAERLLAWDTRHHLEAMRDDLEPPAKRGHANPPTPDAR